MDYMHWEKKKGMRKKLDEGQEQSSDRKQQKQQKIQLNSDLCSSYIWCSQLLWKKSLSTMSLQVVWQAAEARCTSEYC